jgi:hypothetical protein
MFARLTSGLADAATTAEQQHPLDVIHGFAVHESEGAVTVPQHAAAAAAARVAQAEFTVESHNALNPDSGAADEYSAKLLNGYADAMRRLRVRHERAADLGDGPLRSHVSSR